MSKHTPIGVEQSKDLVSPIQEFLNAPSGLSGEELGVVFFTLVIGFVVLLVWRGRRP